MQGTVSKQIQDRINDITYDNVTSLVIRDKSQYRLFYPTDGAEDSSKGIIAVIKVNPNTGQLGYEYADVKGIKDRKRRLKIIFFIIPPNIKF